ncbi:MAG: hypothetical protein U0Q07_11145 [Acidimicrobiales bacterium]
MADDDQPAEPPTGDPAPAMPATQTGAEGSEPGAGREDDAIGARRTPLWLRALGFVVVVGVFVGMVAVVLTRQGDRADRAASTGATARTVPVPGEILGTTTSKAPPALPDGGTTSAARRQNLTTDQVATALEVQLPLETGWTHAVSCGAPQPIAAGEVLECQARTEPPIKEVPPSTVLVVVLDDGGRFTWQRGTTGPVTIAALQDGGLSCADLVARGFPYVSTLAWWNLHDRPAALDPAGTGRPCADAYPAADVDAAFAKATTA